MILNNKHYENTYYPNFINDFLGFNPRFFRMENNAIGGLGVSNCSEFIKSN